jgi:hypothetical protein
MSFAWGVAQPEEVHHIEYIKNVLLLLPDA